MVDGHARVASGLFTPKQRADNGDPEAARRQYRVHGFTTGSYGSPRERCDAAGVRWSCAACRMQFLRLVGRVCLGLTVVSIRAEVKDQTDTMDKMLDQE